MTAPTFSIVIPGFNRVEPLKYTLRSACMAAARLSSPEVILVDDGSEPSLESQLRGFPESVVTRHLRQPNQGSILARLAGLQAATRECVLFLDSDDLIHPDKLARHAAAFAASGADVIYDDMAVARLTENHTAEFSAGPLLAATTDPLKLFLRIQPAPHGPTYRRSYLVSALAQPVVPPTRRMDAAGDVWLYYNLLLAPARVTKIAGAFTAVGPHEEIRFSQHWEKLGAAALAVAEGFARHCPDTHETAAARRAVGEAAFRSWRALPRDYHPGYSERLLSLWRQAPRGASAVLGGPLFQTLAMFLGVEAAGRLLRRRNHDYASCRTLTDAELERLFSS